MSECSVGTLVYQLKPEADFNDMQDAYIKGTSVALVVLGLIYFALVSRARHAPCPHALSMLITTSVPGFGPL